MTSNPLSERMVTIGGNAGLYAPEVAALERDLSTAQAEVARWRKEFHPGRLAPMVVELGHVFRGGESGLWHHKPDADGVNDDLKLWAFNANRWEALTGLDAVTGEKR